MSQPPLNHSSTRPNITKNWFDMKMTLHHPPTHQHTNSISAYISAVPDAVEPNFKGMFLRSPPLTRTWNSSTKTTATITTTTTKFHVLLNWFYANFKWKVSGIKRQQNNNIIIIIDNNNQIKTTTTINIYQLLLPQFLLNFK